MRAQMHALTDNTTASHRRLLQLLTNLSDIVHGHEESVGGAKRVVQCCKENYRMDIGTLTLK